MRIVILLMTVAASAPILAADELADVKAANEVVIRAHNELDADLYFPIIHPEYVGFGKSSVATTDLARLTTNEARMRLERVFSSYESFHITPIETNYRINDGTAIVWGMQRVASKKSRGTTSCGHGPSTSNLHVQGWQVVDASWAYLSDAYSGTLNDPPCPPLVNAQEHWCADTYVEFRPVIV